MDKTQYSMLKVSTLETIQKMANDLAQDYRIAQMLKSKYPTLDIESKLLVKDLILSDIIFCVKNMHINIKDNSDEAWTMKMIYYFMSNFEDTTLQEFLSSDGWNKIYIQNVEMLEPIIFVTQLTKGSFNILDILVELSRIDQSQRYWKLMYNVSMTIGFSCLDWVSVYTRDWLEFMSAFYDRMIKLPGSERYRAEALFKPNYLGEHPTGHMKFLGYDICGSINSLATNLMYAGWNLKGSRDNIAILSGTFANIQNCELILAVEENAYDVQRISIHLPEHLSYSWTSIENTYYDMVAYITRIWGEPNHVENFDYPYYAGCGREIQGIKDGKCHYMASFETDLGKIYVLISSGSVAIAFDDKRN